MGGRGVDWLRAGLARAHAPSSDFDLNPDTVLPAGRALRPAAVLLGITDEDAPKVLLTKRSSALRHHPGQISFPGGKHEASDNSLLDTALRETEEEIGILQQQVDKEFTGELIEHSPAMQKAWQNLPDA